MSTRKDYTSEEWNLVYAAAPMAGIAVSAASVNLVFGLAKEMLAIGKAITELVQQGGDNELLRSLAADLEVAGTNVPRPKELNSPATARPLAIEHLRKLDALLERKSTPAEAEAFKRWLYSIAQRVADASGEGGILGIGSEKVSEAERAALVQIAQALRLDV